MAFWSRNSLPKPSIEAEFDIEGMDVFAIERLPDGSTNFGYRRSKAEVVNNIRYDYTIEDEWTVASTDEQHRAFVARLTAKINKRELTTTKETTNG